MQKETAQTILMLRSALKEMHMSVKLIHFSIVRKNTACSNIGSLGINELSEDIQFKFKNFSR